jgi:DNA-binding NarL/FixJ family response regulator
VRAVAEGSSYLSPEIAGAVLKEYRRQSTNPLESLSPREREILQLIAESATNKNIAMRLRAEYR